MTNDMHPVETRLYRDSGPAPTDFSDKRILVVSSKDWHYSYRLLSTVHQSWKLTSPKSKKTRMRKFMESSAIKELTTAFHERTGVEFTPYALEELIRQARIRCCGYDIDAITGNNKETHIFVGAYPWVAEAKEWVKQNS